MKDLSARFSSDQERLRGIAREKRMQVFQLQLEEHSAVSRILAENQDLERDYTIRFQQRTLLIQISHARSVSCTILLRGDKCDEQMYQKTFRFCPSCIEDVRTRTRAAFTVSSPSRSTSTWLLQRLSLADAKETIQPQLTCASRPVLVSILSLSLVSFGALLWPRGLEAELIAT